jgi:uncharacterized protein YlxW (UPF0749 family)
MSAADAGPAPTAPAVAGRLRRLRGRVRISLSSMVLVVLSAVLGFLIVAQLGSTQRFSRRLQAESEGDLTRILSSLTTSDANLRDQIGTLKLQLQSLQTSSQQSDAARTAAEEQLNALEVLAGTVPVSGPGIVVTATDPSVSLRYDLMIDLVQELRDAGAEAISVNERRVGAASAFDQQGATIVLDGVPLSSPYRIAAIGQPATLDGGLAIPGGALDTLRTQKDVKVDVARLGKVDLPALASPPTFKAARPVGSTP